MSYLLSEPEEEEDVVVVACWTLLALGITHVRHRLLSACAMEQVVDVEAD
jgi:hypothetical protein